MKNKSRKYKRKSHLYFDGSQLLQSSTPNFGSMVNNNPAAGLNMQSFGNSGGNFLSGLSQYGGAAMGGVSGATGLVTGVMGALQVPDVQQIAANGINYGISNDLYTDYSKDAKAKKNQMIQQATSEYFDNFTSGLESLNDMTIDTSSLEDSIKYSNFSGNSTTDLMNQWNNTDMYNVNDYMDYYDELDEQRADYQNSIYDSRLDYLNGMEYQDETSSLGKYGVGKALGNVGSMAASGAAAGSVIPGVGTVLGAIGGGIVGAVSSIFGARKQRKKENERQRVEDYKEQLYNQERDASISELTAMQQDTANLRADQREDALDTFTGLTENTNKQTLSNFNNAVTNASRNNIYNLLASTYADGGELNRSFVGYKLDPSLGVEGNAEALRNKQKDFAKQWYAERATLPEFSWLSEYLPEVNTILDKSKYIEPKEFFSNPNNYSNAEELKQKIAQGLTPAALAAQGMKGFRGAANPKEYTYTNLMPIPVQGTKRSDVEWHEGIGHILGDNIQEFLDKNIGYKNRYDETIDPQKAAYSEAANERHADIWGFRGSNAGLKDKEGNYYIDPKRKLTGKDVEEMIKLGGMIPMGLETLTPDEIANQHNTFANVTKVNNPASNFIGYDELHYGANGGKLNKDFTNGVTTINNGGTHEENPNEGVQMGIAPDGIPNLVEEGEVIFNDYVYSNRLSPNKDMRKKNKYKGKSFADIAKYISKESEERPNDPISKRGLEEGLIRLANNQELIRQEKEANKTRRYARGGKLGRLYEGKGNKTNYLSYLRYAPALGSGIGALMASFSDPDYYNADLIGNVDLAEGIDFDSLSPSDYAKYLTQTKAKADTIGAETIGDYLSYDPLDTQYTLNKMNQQAAATRRAIMNTSGGNSAAARASLLAADYNAQNAVGEALRQDAQYNQAMKERVAAFNRGTNQYNADAATRAAMANQQAKNSIELANAQMEAQRKQALAEAAYKADNVELNKAKMQANINQAKLQQAYQQAVMRNQIETLYNQNKSNAWSNFLGDLGNIGTESVQQGWMDKLISSGALKFDKGGLLTKPKRKRRK